jgi:putative zinc finger/helix-turn-helix YgiT family protein
MVTTLALSFRFTKKASMSERLPCPVCEQTRDVDVVEREETVFLKGKEIRFSAVMNHCLVCGEDFEAPGQLDRNLLAAREVYARLYESPRPEQIVALRSRYGASQKAFGLILGFGELTINSYEQGSVPDSANRLLLKLAENPVVFRAMYEINSSRIGALQRQRIESSDGYLSAKRWRGLGALGATPQKTRMRAK